MRHLCPVSDKKAKQGYSRSGVSKLRPAGQIWPVKPFYPAREGISSGRIDILSIMKKQYTYETFVDLVEYNLFRNNHIK